MSRWGVALALWAGAAAAQDAATTPLMAPAAGDPATGISEWLPATRSASEMRRLIESDRPIAVVRPGEAGPHEAHLSEGHRALLKKFPGYRLTVYPSRRVAHFPEAIYAASARNAATAKLKGPNLIEGATLGLPFLRPQGGLEAMWNHRLRYRGDSSETHSSMVIVDRAGPGKPVRQRKLQLNVYANLAQPAARPMVYYNYRAQAGSRFSANYLVLQHEPLAADFNSRNIWIRQVTHRMLRAPASPVDLGTTPSQGMMLLDMLDMYGGEGDFSFYTWKLLGKRDMLVPYSALDLSEGRVDRAALLTPSHPDPDLLRYEMHRVWVVEASLLPQYAHQFRKRVFYLDEDSWNILLAESYRADGTLERFQECHLVQDFGNGIPECRPVFMHDLAGDRYLVDDLLAEPSARRVNLAGLTPDDFSPRKVSKAPNP